jgi:Uma2 family endonuclease
MSLTTHSLTPPVSFAPHPMRWTVAEFHRVYNDPVFEGRRFMLIEGEVLEMPIPNPPHSVSLGLAEESLRRVFASGYWVRSQMPLVLGQSSDPMPDMAVVRGSPRDYAGEHPKSADLIIEVADSSLAYDTHEKASLYAAAGIADYWVVDLVDRQLIVHRGPVADASQPHGSKYASITTLAPTASAAPPAAAGAAIQIVDLLP